MNEPRRRGPIARIAIGLWDTVNFTRRLVFNLLFLALLVLVLAMLFGGGKLAPIGERSTLVIAPEGRLVEQYSCDPLSRSFARATNSQDCREVRLRDLLRALDAARTDTRIERVVLHLDDLQPSGFASLRDVAAAVLAAWDDEANRETDIIAALDGPMGALRAALAAKGARTPREAGAPRKPREGTKQETVLAMLRREEGATIAQICEATGWQQHTVRGFFVGLKKRQGITVVAAERIRQVGPNKEGARGSYTIYKIEG